MATVANDRGIVVQELPPGRAAEGYGIRVGDLLTLPCLAGSSMLAGEAGLSRVVRRLNVMETPDILPWVKPHELLLTTGFPLRAADGGADVDGFVRLVRELDARGLAAVGIKLGRYLDEVPAPVLRAADELGFPLLRLPDDVAFDDVLSEVFGELLDRQGRALSRADELHRALASIVLEGGDLPQIAEELARLLDAAVLITTTDGRVQAEGGTVSRLDALRGLDAFEGTGRFRTERVGHDLDAGSGELAMVPIVAGGVDHGRIAAYRPEEPLPPPGVEAIERAATVAALVITKQLAVSAVESKFRGDYLRDVLTGTAGDPPAVVTHCASLGWNVDRSLVVLVAELDPGEPGVRPGPALRSPLERLTAAWEQVVRAVDKGAPVVGFSQEVVVVLPVEVGDADTRDAAARAVDEVVARVHGDGGGGRRSFCAGVSRVVTGPAGIAEAYVQARKALAVGRRVRGRGSVAHFDSLGVHRLLSLVPDGAELRAFANEVLRDLARDTVEAADLRHTLQALLDTNLNVAETARLLHFHYNTLRYRIGKLERIIGSFTTNPQLRLDVALALQVIEMRGI